MNQKISEYHIRKNNICSLLEKTISFYKGYDEEEVAGLELLKSQVENGKFSIIVAGQFSSGKSTFLNALMGEKYLPSFTKETTATINELKPIDESPTGKPCVIVNYKDGSSHKIEEVDFQTISKYVSTDGDDVVNKVKSVEIFLDSPFLNSGVRLIDTPGLNGIAEGHAAITKSEFEQAHAGIFMFCATQPGAKTDYDILKEMKSYGNSLIFVLNQIDTIKNSEGETPESVIANLRAGFAQKFPGEELPEIWPVSSYEALVARSTQMLEHHERTYESPEDRAKLLKRSRMEPFEERLMRYLTQGERAKDEMLSPIRQVETKLGKTITSEEEHLQMLESDVTVSNLQQRQDEITQEIARIQEKNKKDSSVIRVKINSLLSDTEDGIKSGSREIKTCYIGKLESSEADLEDFEANARSFLRRMDGEYRRLIEDNLSGLQKNVKALIEEKYSEYCGILSAELQNKSNAADIQYPMLKLDSEMFDGDIDIENDSNELETLYDEQYALSMQISDHEMAASIASNNERRRNDAKETVRQVKKDYQDRVASYGDRPESEQRRRTVVKKTGGLGGLFKWIGTGSREYYATEYYMDSSRQEAYDRKIEECRNSYEEELEDAQRELNNLRNADTDVVSHQMTAARAQKEYELLERKIERLKEKRDRDIEKKQKKKLRAAKEYVEEILETLDKSYMGVAINRMESQKDNISSMITSLIDEVFSMACVEHNRELERIMEQLNSGMAEKEAIKTQIHKDIEELRQLLDEAVDLRRDVEDIHTDVIEMG